MSLSKLVLGLVFNVVFFALLLFVPAGTLHWWRAWMFLAVALVVTTASVLRIFSQNPDLLAERYRGLIQKGQPLWDKILVQLLVISYVGQIVFIPLDVFKLHLMPKPGLLVSYLGLALFRRGLVDLHPRDEDQSLCCAGGEVAGRETPTRHRHGVYAVVRHPMYAGFAPMAIGPALWLESSASALLAIVPIAVLAVRAVFEERFLKRELEGYEGYTKKVRYRLIPFIW